MGKMIDGVKKGDTIEVRLTDWPHTGEWKAGVVGEVDNTDSANPYYIDEIDGEYVGWSGYSETRLPQREDAGIFAVAADVAAVLRLLGVDVTDEQFSAAMEIAFKIKENKNV